MIFIHLAGALTDRIDTKAGYLEVSVDDLSVTDTYAGVDSWTAVDNSVYRAPLVVLAFLRRHRASYRLALVRYSGELAHLYAIRVDGKLHWDDFMATLATSHDPAFAHSYQWFHDHPNAALRQRLGLAGP